MDRSTVFRWYRNLDQNWQVDETYIRVGGRWRYWWRVIDANGQLVDFKLTARRDAKAAKAFLNNRVESDHAARKRLLGYRQSFRSLRSAKATLKGIEAIRTVKNGHIHKRLPGVRGEIEFIHQLFGMAA